MTTSRVPNEDIELLLRLRRDMVRRDVAFLPGAVADLDWIGSGTGIAVGASGVGVGVGGG